MPAKPKAKPRSAKIGAKAKREAVTKVFHQKNLDPEYLDFLYSRRHLATVREPAGHRELKYIVELDELETAISKTLDRIRKRDGMKYFKEAAVDLLRDVACDIHFRTRRKGLRQAMAKLEDWNSYDCPTPAAIEAGR
jgi:hypothetical protein